MVSWHIPLAMSGQLADLASPTNRSLTFAARRYTVCLTVGSIELDLLSVDGSKAPRSPFRLVGGGDCVDWDDGAGDVAARGGGGGTT